MATLLSLPFEIRKICYEYLFADALVVTKAETMDEPSEAIPQLWRPRNEILQVSRQIRAKALQSYTITLVHSSPWRPDLAEFCREELFDFMRSSVTFLLVDIEDFHNMKDFWPAGPSQEGLNFPNIREIMVRVKSKDPVHTSCDLGGESGIRDALESVEMDRNQEEILQGILKNRVWKQLVRELSSVTSVISTSIRSWTETEIQGSTKYIGTMIKSRLASDSVIIIWNLETGKPHARHWREWESVEMGSVQPLSAGAARKECLTEGYCSICEILVLESDPCNPRRSKPTQSFGYPADIAKNIESPRRRKETRFGDGI